MNKLPLILFLVFFQSLSYSQDKSLLAGKAKEWNEAQRAIGFQENKGQVCDVNNAPAPYVLFKVAGRGVNIWITDKGITWQFVKMKEGEDEASDPLVKKKKDKIYEWSRVDMLLKDALIRKANLVVEEEVPSSRADFYLGHCPEGVLDVKTFRKVTITGIYQGIDWLLYVSDDGFLKQDFIVHPGADPSQLKLVYEGDGQFGLLNNSIRFSNALGEVNEGELLCYQGDTRITSAYTMKATGRKIRSGFSYEIGVNTGEYDRSRKLIIDPTLAWGSYYAGSSYEGFASVETDASGNVFTCGYEASVNFPVLNPGGGAFFQGANAGSNDIFIVKFSNAGVRLWATYYGGSGGDNGISVAVDAPGNLFVTGVTYSANFPVFNPGGGAYFQAVSGGSGDVVLLKFSNTGARLWATHYGGSGEEQGMSLFIGAGNTLFAGGYTSSANFPTLNPGGGAYFQAANAGQQDGFILKFTNAGASLWATYVGGAQRDFGLSIAIDASDNLSFCGWTDSQNTFPVVNPGGGAYFQATNAGGFSDIFIVRFSPAGTMLWSTLYGDALTDLSEAICTDMNGNIFLIGTTSSTAFPTLNPGGGAYFQAALSGGLYDAVLLKFSPAGVRQWATYFGGSGNELINATGYYRDRQIYSDCAGNIYATGQTTSANFPTMNPGSGHFNGVMNGPNDIFYLQFSNNGNLLWSTYSGSSGGDYPAAVCVDPNGNLFFVGEWISGGSNGTLNPGGGAYYNGAFTASDDSYIQKFTSAATLSATVTGVNLACNGQCIGTATAFPSSCYTPYTYSWSNAQTTQTSTGLCAGVYTVTVTDGIGTTVTRTVQIVQPAAMAMNTAGSGVNCNGGATGAATVTVTGGTGAYTYSWNSGATSSSATGLSAGTYTLSVTDSSGCTATQTVAITQPAVLAVLTGSGTTNCGASTGTLSASASGGTGAYTYSWNNGQTAVPATGLSAGIYTLSVTDNNGCTTTATASVTSSGGGTASAATLTNVSCNGGANGSAGSTITGGTSPYTYSWSNGQSTAAATSLSAGTYTITITDTNGCIATQTVSIAQPSAINPQTSSISANCGANDGSASVTATGGTGAFTYSWSNGGTQSAISNLQSGIYTVLITDGNGCTATATATVGASAGPSANAGSNVTISPGSSTTLNGSGGGTYSWSPSLGLSCSNCQNPTASPTVTTTYTLTVTDTNGCTATAAVTVFVEIPCASNIHLDVPNAFSPNGDGHNDVLLLTGWKECVNTFLLVIYDRWGEKVYESEDPSDGWNGTYKGKALDPAVFAFYISATNKDNQPFIRKGNISLLK